MCGRFNIIDDPSVQALCDRLGIDTTKWPIRFSDDIAPASKVSIIRQGPEGRCIGDAIDERRVASAVGSLSGGNL